MKNSRPLSAKFCDVT